MRTLHLRDFGPIHKGDVTLGDLTVLVGPQATGKSLLAQLIKLIDDAALVRSTLQQYGFVWSRQDPLGDLLSLYFGGGMNGVVSAKTRIVVDGQRLNPLSLLDGQGGSGSPDAETVALIPAQRVLVLQDGWPKPFMAYSPGDPFCMRDFSEALRRLLELGLGDGDAVFPQPRRLKSELRRLIDRGIYTGGTLHLDTEGMRKRVVLRPRGSETKLPFNVWSAGQREFTPLLIGMYRLLPGASQQRKGQVQRVIIEEPEMGLHPEAIVSFCLLVLELLWREYQVVISTHSPAILDVVWAVRELSTLPREDGIRALGSIFGVGPSGPMGEVLRAALGKELRVYHFDRSAGPVVIHDISTLNPGDDDPRISGWGGLTGFSGRVAVAIGEAISAAGSR